MSSARFEPERVALEDPPSDLRFPPIADRAVIGDCHSAALVCSDGTIDWCCLPRFDSPSVFASLLDPQQGGSWTLEARDLLRRRRRYLEGTLVLETTVETDAGTATVTDFLAMRRGGRRNPRREIVRLIQGVDGRVGFTTTISPRFDYGQTKPWIREHGDGAFSAVGSSNGLVIWSDAPLERDGDHDLVGTFSVNQSEYRAQSLRFEAPEGIDDPEGLQIDRLSSHLEETIQWWRSWSSRAQLEPPYQQGAVTSAIVLKALTHAPTGAMVAAPTTSLPEAWGGTRNWDYRYSWIRDSSFAVRALDEIGLADEAEGFRRFVERSAAGSVQELQVMYGVGGERRLPELALDTLSGYRGARPVRIGNDASGQFQLDMYGELLDVAWEWHVRGRSPTRDYRRFLTGIADEVARVWTRPDRGIWEVRGEAQHFVHSKVMCWVALDRALKFSDALTSDGDATTSDRSGVHRQIRDRIERDGYDPERGVFRRSFGSTELDASLLLLPEYGFVPYDDPRMIRTADAIREELGSGGLIMRYRADDGLEDTEGAFVACTFWLAECFARQGRIEEATQQFDRACATANDLGLFSEEFDPERDEMLGNFPQALTHLAHINASVALAGHELPG